MEPSLARLLATMNPWLANPGALQEHVASRRPVQWYAREARSGLEQVLDDKRKAHVVIGPRQAGKSSLIWELLADRRRPVLYVNCEEPLVREWLKSPATVAAALGDWLPEDGTLYLEEVQ